MEKIIIGFPNYTVDEFGVVRSYTRPESFIKKTSLSTRDSRAYEQVKLSSNGMEKCFKVHRLVAEYFLPNFEGKPDINHIDGNKLNNKMVNLQWVTKSENCLHAHSTGLQSDRKGEEHWLAKLKNEDVVLIRELYPSLSLKKISILFGVSKSSISGVVNRKTWSHI